MDKKVRYNEKLFDKKWLEKRKEILTREKTNIEYLNKKYTCFGIELEDSYVFYFLEDTYYKEAAEKYELTRPAVATIVFDNEGTKRENLDEDMEHLANQVISHFQKK